MKLPKIPNCYSFGSTVPEVERLRVYGLPKNAVLDVKRIVREGDTTVYVDREGKMYSARVTLRGHFCMGRGINDAFIRIAGRLGLITKAQVRKHLEDAKAYDVARQRSEQVARFKKTAKDLGIELTQRQLKSLK